jgi:hypothetical protein
VKLINLDGVAIIGPGSEWFWIAVSGIALTVTFVAIYRQLRLLAHAGADAQIDAITREAASERFNRFVLDVLTAIKSDPASRTALPEGSTNAVANHWERVGTLGKSGHLDLELLWDLDGGTVQIWWMLLEPWVRIIRERAGDRRVLENFEWLSRAMAGMDRDGGHATPTSEFVFGTMDSWIESVRDVIRIEESLRVVTTAAPTA